MGILNDQVRMGASLAEAPRRMGYIRRLGVLEPPKPIVTTVEGIGLAGGLLTILTAFFLKGTARALVLATGGLTAGIAGTSAIMRAVAKPAAPAAAAPKPNPNIPLGPPLTPQQLIQTAQRTLAPIPLMKPAPVPAASDYKPGQMVFESDLFPAEEEYAS